MSYILIILYTLGGIGGGIALTTVDKFPTKEACDLAGLEWHKTEHEAARDWVCLPIK